MVRFLYVELLFNIIFNESFVSLLFIVNIYYIIWWLWRMLLGYLVIVVIVLYIYNGVVFVGSCWEIKGKMCRFNGKKMYVCLFFVLYKLIYIIRF